MYIHRYTLKKYLYIYIYIYGTSMTFLPHGRSLPQRAMQYHATPRNAMPCYAMQCHCIKSIGVVLFRDQCSSLLMKCLDLSANA